MGKRVPLCAEQLLTLRRACVTARTFTILRDNSTSNSPGSISSIYCIHKPLKSLAWSS